MNHILIGFVLVTLFYSANVSGAPSTSAPGEKSDANTIQSQFSAYPDVKYRPHTFWHWVNGNINKDAIDKDIEALFNTGYGGVLMSDVNAGIPKGPVHFNSDEWLDLLVYTLEGLKQKGMQFAMHNSPGYSGVGNKDLPTNMTMKELTWTETQVSSNGSNGTFLEQPFFKMGVYEDIYALAYPAAFGEGRPWRDAVLSTSLTGVLQTTDITSSINLEQPLRLNVSSDYLTFAMTDPWTAQSIAVYRIPEIPLNTFDGARDYPPSWTLSASNDSLTWQSIVKFTGPPLRAMDAPAVGVFSPVTANFYRVQPSGPSWVTSVQLTGGARLADWATKSHASPGNDVSNPAIVSTVPSPSVIDPNTVIDVSRYLDAKGQLNWRPKNGIYTVVRLGYTVTGQYMPATPDDFGALNVDLFSSAAIDAQMITHTNRIIEATKQYIPDTFYGMEIDSYELGMQNWGGNIAEDFQEYIGYSLVPWVLSATGRILQSAEATEKFLFDFRRTHARLTATKSYRYFKDVLGSHGLALLSEPYGDGPFDGMEVAAEVSYAYGEFWAHNTYGSDGYMEIGTSSLDFRICTPESIPSVNPAESFTGQPVSSAYTEHPYQLKAQADREMSLGTNRFFFHDFVLQPVEAAFPGMSFGPFGTHFDRQETWSNQSIAWLTQISRASFILQRGTRLPDTLSFIGEEMSNGATISYESPYSVPLSYQQDIFGRSNLFNLTPIARKAVWPSGTGVSLLLFPVMAAASVEVLEHILYLAKAGVPILLQSTIPSRALGLNDTDAEVIALATELWDLSGNGNVFLDKTAATVLEEIGISPDFTYTSPVNDAAFYFGHNLVGTEDVYFITNQLRRPVDAVLSLRATSGTPMIWDPSTGEVTSALVWSTLSGRTEIRHTFDSYESVFIWLSQTAPKPTKQITSISKDDSILYTSTPYRPFTNTPWANVSGTWTLSIWANPEVAEYGSVGYIFYPPVSSAYGTGHSAAGIYFALNGLEIVEASTSTPVILTTLASPWTGEWTHIALVYTNNLPILYVNGDLVWTGTTSSFTVHPGLDAQDNPTVMIHRFDGDIAGVNLTSAALSPAAIKSVYSSGVPAPYPAKPISVTTNSELLIRENGNYSIATTDLSSSSNVTTTFHMPVSEISTITLENPWTVTFPVNRMPKNTSSLSIILDTLSSLHLHSDFDVAHFSGTATYRTSFTLPSSFLSDQNNASASSSRLLLTLGRLANIATVTINSHTFSPTYLPPYEHEITPFISLDPNATNQVQIAVTNQWVNRLIGDESLPVENPYNYTNEDFAVEEWPEWWVQGKEKKDGDRVTFSAWKFYNINSPLLQAGLLGPVTVTKAVVKSLDELM